MGGADPSALMPREPAGYFPAWSRAAQSGVMKDVIMRNNKAALLSTEGRPGTATARLISGARGAIWPFAGPSASTVVSA